MLIMADPNLIHLGLFMVTGLPFMAKCMKMSQDVVDSATNIFIEKNKKFGIIIITINNEFINITYKDIFICRVNVNDY